MNDGRNKICVLSSIVMLLSVIGVWTCGWKEIWSVLKKILGEELEDRKRMFDYYK